MRLTTKPLIFALTLLCSAVLPSAYAEQDKAPDWYQVELIVFQHGQPATTTPTDASTTTPPLPISQPNLAQALMLSPSNDDDMLMPYESLPADHFYLNNAYKRLLNSKDYYPLLHTAWLQPVSGMGAARLVQLNADNDNWQVHGTIQLKKQRYFKAHVNLLLSSNDHFADAAQSTYQIYRAERLRNKELHYLDNPMFGVLIEIRPYKPTS